MKETHGCLDTPEVLNKNFGKYDFFAIIAIIAIIAINVITSLYDFFNSYVMPAMLNDHLNKKVFTEQGLHPCDGVKGHLTLRTNASWNWMLLFSIILVHSS